MGTHFEPKKGESNHTFLCPKQHACAQGDFGMHVGDKVSHKINGKTVQGEVIAVDQSSGQDEDVWTVLFEDGQLFQCDRCNSSRGTQAPS